MLVDSDHGSEQRRSPARLSVTTDQLTTKIVTSAGAA